MNALTLPKSRLLLACLLAMAAAPFGAYVYPAAALPAITGDFLSVASSFFAPSVYVAPAVNIAPGLIAPGAMAR